MAEHTQRHHDDDGATRAAAVRRPWRLSSLATSRDPPTTSHGDACHVGAAALVELEGDGDEHRQIDHNLQPRDEGRTGAGPGSSRLTPLTLRAGGLTSITHQHEQQGGVIAPHGAFWASAAREYSSIWLPIISVPRPDRIVRVLVPNIGRAVMTEAARIPALKGERHLRTGPWRGARSRAASR